MIHFHCFDEKVLNDESYFDFLLDMIKILEFNLGWFPVFHPLFSSSIFSSFPVNIHFLGGRITLTK